MEEYHFYTAAGYVGAFLFILSYALLSFGKLKAEQKLYQVMNILGALMLAINALNILDFPTLIVNGVWFIIGLTALVRIINGRGSEIKK
jgi:hypothetical protein